ADRPEAQGDLHRVQGRASERRIVRRLLHPRRHRAAARDDLVGWAGPRLAAGGPRVWLGAWASLAALAPAHPTNPGDEVSDGGEHLHLLQRARIWSFA